MSPPPPHRASRLAAAGRWLAPSVVAACLGVAVAGLVEGTLAGFGALGAAASAGYAWLLAIPVCLAGALAVRGLWAAWRPARLAARVLDEDGAAPRLGGWLGFLLLAAFLLGWATFNGTRLLSQVTTFKVDVVAITLPAIVIVTAALLAGVSRPAVDVLTAGLAALDRRLRRRLGRSLVTPRVILGGTITLLCGLVLIGWYGFVRPRLGALDAGILLHPVLAIALTAAVHPIARRLTPRWRLRAVVAPTLALTVAILGAAAWVRAQRASLMLSMWAQPSIGGLAIDTLFDVDVLRGQASLERYRPVPRPGAPRRDIVLVTIDTVRFDRTPLGGGRAEMPTLATLGRRGAVFERAVAPGNVTRRSMPAMMLGASPPRVRGRVVGWALRLDPRHVPLAERLQAAGYETAGFFCCGSFWEPAKKTGYARGLDRVFIDQDGEVLATEARRWLTNRYAAPASGPTFAWLHFIEPHNWMKRKDGGTGSSAKDTKLRRYDKALGEVDGFLAEIVAAIEAIPEDRRPLLVITSDHGEGLGDHGAPYHSSDLYDSQIRVPLVVVGPGVKPRRIAEAVSLTDLAPTLLDLAGFVPPILPDMDGRSIADLITGERAGDPDGGYAYAVMLKDRSSTRAARAIVRGHWKLIDGPDGLELYDLRADPSESKNLATARSDQVAELQALLDERAAIDATPPF